jgi:hypothetical protein
MIKKLLMVPLVLAILVAPTISSAATAEEALLGCKGYPDASHPKNCEAYFEIGRDYLLSDDPAVNPKGKLCLEESLTLSDMIALVISWIEEHPDQASASLYEAMHSALSTRFACQ